MQPTPTHNIIKNILLIGAALAVGAFIAVFGQVYQTGADSYEFFMAWTIGIIIWTISADFAPLWALFLLLVNTTIITFAAQHNWVFLPSANLLFVANVAFLLADKFLFTRNFISQTVPSWLHKIVSLVAMVFITFAIISTFILLKDGELSRETHNLQYAITSWVLYVVAFIMCYQFGMRNRRAFYIAILGASVLSIIASGIAIACDYEPGIFLLISIILIAGTILSIQGIVRLNKQWNDNQ